MKYCPKCGVQLPDEAQFCRNCGTTINPTNIPETADPIDNRQAERSRPSRSRWHIVAIIGGILIAVAGVFFIKGGYKGGQNVVPNTEAIEQSTNNEPETLGIGNSATSDEEGTEITEQSVRVVTPGERVITNGQSTTPKVEAPAEGDGFESLDDTNISVQQRIEYIEALLERSEDELSRELAKGNAANQAKVKELRDGINDLREALDKLKR